MNEALSLHSGCSCFDRKRIIAGSPKTESSMLAKLPLLAGLFMAAILTPLPGSAATLSTATTVAVTDSDQRLAQKVQYGYDRWRYDEGRRYDHRRRYDHDRYYDRCRWVRHRCADRYGWGTWEYRRCVAWRGCGRWHYRRLPSQY